ncbi:MAG TPA: tetratricopeptide repeat protein [Bacteroidales bacterium]|nr:tetratricopeptide repeat protein [Bacteroidales bacterium]HRX97835.1 tetratricopeptide repeat protein [Bacteroidales bacterium]
MICKGRNLLLLFIVIFFACSRQNVENPYDEGVYLNLNDTVKYVGREACKACHIINYLSYSRTGMGLSFDTANRNKSAAVIGPDSILFDPYKNLSYQPFWIDDTLFLKEFRLINGDTVHKRIQKIDYVVGSGHHTNSHIFLSGDYAFQAPFTYYTQDGRFDFPPGFEDGNNSRFDRKIGLECMSCHNALPDFVLGSENKYNFIPDGIDCERCHGPGEIHVKNIKSGIAVDTSKYIDYSIVTPTDLPIDRQTDICARCHLQGTMVLMPGKDFYSFRPGMRLIDVMDIFMPLFEGGKEDFIMASHYERMSQSNCYIGSEHGFNCISCHNPHISAKETKFERYLNVCMGCHSESKNTCTEDLQIRAKADDNCIECHMRQSGSRDIPHVRVHDHKISIPPTEESLKSERVFKGLIAVNNPNADSLTMARGYLLEYETYHPDEQYLDSAWIYLQAKNNSNSDYHFNALVNYYFLKNNYVAITQLAESKGITTILNKQLTTIDYSNSGAWTAYRIGQAFEAGNNLMVASYFYEKAVNLAKYNLEFQNKLGSLFVKRGKIIEAEAVFKFILNEDEKYTAAWVNLGFIKMHQNQINDAENMLNKALALDPDNLQALLNKAAVKLEQQNYAEVIKLIYRIEKISPDNPQALQLKKLIGK